MLLFTHSNTVVLWRKSPAPSAKNGATCYPEASDWNYINNIKAKVKRCVLCMTSIYMWWPIIDPCYHFLWDGKKYKYLLHLRSHRGKCHSFLHRPARSDSYPVGGPLHKKVGSCHNLSGSGGQKRDWQQRPFIMWQEEGATKPKAYYGRRQIGLGQRGTQWESPWWVKVNWRNIEIGQKSSYFQRVSNCQLMTQRTNKQVVAILLSRWLDQDQTQEESDSIDRSRFTLGWWSLTTTSSSGWWSGWKDSQQQKTFEPLFLITGTELVLFFTMFISGTSHSCEWRCWASSWPR